MRAMNFVIYNKVHKVQTNNKLQKVRTSQLWPCGPIILLRWPAPKRQA